jgi:hypothetical protein
MLAFSKRSSSNCLVSSATFDSAVISLSCAAHHAGEEGVKRMYTLVEWYAGTHAGGSRAVLVHPLALPVAPLRLSAGFPDLLQLRRRRQLNCRIGGIIAAARTAAALLPLL